MKKLLITLSLLLVLSLIAAVVACPGIHTMTVDSYVRSLQPYLLPVQKSTLVPTVLLVSAEISKPTFPKAPSPDGKESMIIFAGNDTTVCLTANSIPVSGQASNCHYHAWGYLGDGFFDVAINLNTFYVPGAQDIASGFAVLYLTGISPPPEYTMIVDTLIITIIPKAQSFAGCNQYICEGDILALEGQASNYSQISWSSSGDGSFDDLHILNPNYTHGVNDLAEGTVFLSLEATPVSPCVQPAVNTMQISITHLPTGYAGNDTALCINDVLQINAQASYYDEIMWFTDGNGSFSNSTILNPIYFPDSTDYENGSVILTMMLTPEDACVNYFVDSLQLSLYSHPEVSTGSNQTICQGEVVQCQATASDYSNLHWEALGGNGSFDDASLLNTTYFPGPHEINQGFCFLYLTAQAIDPCTGFATGYFKIYIIPDLVVSAGNDQNVCSNVAAQLTGDVNAYSSFAWQSLGDGSFANVNTLSPQYFAGSNDIENESTLITLSAVSASPCAGSAIDTVKLSYSAPASVFAGSNGLACATVELTGSAQNHAASLWISSGDGTFDDCADPGTKYYAGSQDLANSVVTLHLYAGSNDPCSEIVSDEVVYIFDKPAFVVQNTPIQDVMVDQSINLSVEVASFSALTYQWYFQGNAIENGNSAVLNIQNAKPENAGVYYCVCSNNCFSIHSDTSQIYIYQAAEQTIEIKNGWNAISSYLYLEDVEITTILDPIISNVVILVSEEGIFWPNHDTQTFFTWNSDIGYMLKTDNNDNLIIEGLIKYPFEAVILNPGWNVIPIKSTCPLAVNETFSAFPDITFIQEIGGLHLYWPEKGIYTLDSLSPGKAYHIYNAGSNDLMFTFPGCED